MFVRAKLVKGKKYGYLVENVWKRGKVKQVVKKYLGLIVPLNEPTVESSILVDFSKNLKIIMQTLIANELISRGFKNSKGEAYRWQNIVVNLTKGTIRMDDKSVVLFLNGRYLHGRHLRDLLDFFAPEGEEDTPGQKLAAAFSDAGISIPKEDFVQLYKKIYLNQ